MSEDIRIHREGSNVVLEADGIKLFYELHQWENEAHQWGDDFWERAQQKFEEAIPLEPGMPTAAEAIRRARDGEGSA